MWISLQHREQTFLCLVSLWWWGTIAVTGFCVTLGEAVWVRELGMRLEFMDTSKQTRTGRCELVLLCSQLAKYWWMGFYCVRSISFCIDFCNDLLRSSSDGATNLSVTVWSFRHFRLPSNYLNDFSRVTACWGNQPSIRESILMQTLDWLWRELGPFANTANTASGFRRAICSSVCKTRIYLSSLDAKFIKKKKVCHVKCVCEQVVVVVITVQVVSPPTSFIF